MKTCSGTWSKQKGKNPLSWGNLLKAAGKLKVFLMALYLLNWPVAYSGLYAFIRKPADFTFTGIFQTVIPSTTPDSRSCLYLRIKIHPGIKIIITESGQKIIQGILPIQIVKFWKKSKFLYTFWYFYCILLMKQN
jgi:hypothetical protein